MLCKKCGTKLNGQEKFCSKCGWEVGQEITEVISPEEETEKSEKKKPFIGKIIAGIAVVCVLVGGLFWIDKTTNEEGNGNKKDVVATLIPTLTPTPTLTSTPTLTPTPKPINITLEDCGEIIELVEILVRRLAPWDGHYPMYVAKEGIVNGQFEENMNKLDNGDWSVLSLVYDDIVCSSAFSYLDGINADVAEELQEENGYGNYTYLTIPQIEHIASSITGQEWNLDNIDELEYRDDLTTKTGYYPFGRQRGDIGSIQGMYLDNFNLKKASATKWKLTAAYQIWMENYQYQLAEVTVMLVSNEDSCFNGLSIADIEVTELDNHEWMRAYLEYLNGEEFAKLNEEFRVRDFYLIYLDEDAIPELYLTCGDFYTDKLLFYNNGTVQELSSFSGRLERYVPYSGWLQTAFMDSARIDFDSIQCWKNHSALYSMANGCYGDENGWNEEFICEWDDENYQNYEEYKAAIDASWVEQDFELSELKDASQATHLGRFEGAIRFFEERIYVTFGKYEQDNNMANGAERIEWIVLDKKDDKMLLLSKYVLDEMPYHEEYVDVTWETCAMRSWLNEDFYKTAFTSTEQQYIAETYLINEDNPEYGTDGGNNTYDKVFLLSIDEATTYFDSDPDATDPTRRAKVTEYIWWCSSIIREYYGNGNWCLRSLGEYWDKVTNVKVDGSINSEGDYFVESQRYGGYIAIPAGVRPAIWVEVE